MWNSKFLRAVNNLINIFEKAGLLCPSFLVFLLTYIGHLYISGDDFMQIDKSLLTGSTTMLILRLLDEKDMYGYHMIEELAKKSDDTFSLKAGTLYPLLHGLEKQGMVNSYDDNADSARVRKYYSITKKGRGLLAEKKAEWKAYSSAVNQVLQGGASFAAV